MHTLTGSFTVGGVGTLAATINNGSTSYEIRLSQRDENAQVKLTAAICGGNYTLNGYAMLVDSDELFGFVFGDAMRPNATGVQVSLLPHVALNIPGAVPCARGTSEGSRATFHAADVLWAAQAELFQGDNPPTPPHPPKACNQTYEQPACDNIPAPHECKWCISHNGTYAECRDEGHLPNASLCYCV